MNKFSDKIEIHSGYNSVVDRDAKLSFIEKFGILKLESKGIYKDMAPDQETALIIFSGSCTVQAGGRVFDNIGGRKSVFEGLPTAVYIPPGEEYTINSKDAEIGICKAKCDAFDGEPVLITGEQVKIMHPGNGNWSREVRLILGPDSVAQKMILGETINPPGNWSGYPPHRHENDNLPVESLHDELYFFKTDKPQGWGIERIYSPDRSVNEFIFLQNNTVTYMPWGYHPIVAAPGYNLYYMFFLAGNQTKLGQFEDPEHSWIKNSK